ncbi:MAG: polymer-forming cytoskeletal protein [Candidatus Gracilibacteria bacterium]|nr:polymer-forming cytoskeletal protein [Candidatus Gracilibacteria bacterium]
MLRFLIGVLLNICVTLGLFYVFIFSKTVLIEEGVELDKNISATKSKVILSEYSKLNGDIELQEGEIILRNFAQIQGNILLNTGKIHLGEGTKVTGNIITSGGVLLGSGATVEGNISKNSQLTKHSHSEVTGEKPSVFITSDYPDFLKYFDVLPEKHKQAFGYIFLTSHNMDIRGKESKPEEYFKKVFIYKENKLQEINKQNNLELLEKLYQKAHTYINILPERKVDRFGVAFVTKNYANNINFADMYISSSAASPILFMHETGHVLDYKYAYIDYHIPSYPYPNKASAITDYGQFHKGEDFAEAYRYYVLHHKSFQNKIVQDKVRQKKYDYLKQYVFHGKEYN